jgi:predicted ATPase
MANSEEIRRLERKWQTNNHWPKWLEWLEIKNIRGWSGQRVKFNFPIMAIIGENGSGKSTILQTSACAYQNDLGRTWYPSEFFPETYWDNLEDIRIDFGYKQGNDQWPASVRKPTSRWRGQRERPRRKVSYNDLSRLQPVGTRVGYARIAKTRHTEHSSTQFTPEKVSRLSQIMGRDYDFARMAVSDIDTNREIPVLSKGQTEYSGFHQGSGEITTAELLREDLPQYGLVLIDEIESSIHPRVQRRLIRDLAHIARKQECQIIITTHSPYVLEELPLYARAYILESGGQKEILYGVSPHFAMTKMDSENHPECELYVEDDRAAIWLGEILSNHAPESFNRCDIIPYGSSEIGRALGQMSCNNRFRRPTVVFLDGDQDPATGCNLLPGDGPPERVVLERLTLENFGNLNVRLNRSFADVSDACSRALTQTDHHRWLKDIANDLRCGSDALWQAMCAEWTNMINGSEVDEVTAAVENVLD